MALRFLCFIFLLLHLQRSIIVSATTSVVFYTDDTCKDSYFTVRTDTKAGNGSCGEANGANGARISMLDSGCSGTKRLRSVSYQIGLICTQLVTIYSDQYCSDNRTAVPVEICTSLDVGSLGSFSVDCPLINGTLAGYNTTSAQTQSPSPSPSTSTSSNPSPQQDITTTTWPSSSSTQTSTSTPTDSHPPLSATPSSPQTPSSWTTGSSSTSSFPPSSSTQSSSPSQASKESNDNEGMSKKTQTILEVVIPVVTVFIFGVLGARWHFQRPKSTESAPQSSGPTAIENPQGSSSSPPMESRDSQDSGRMSTDTENPSMVHHAQGRP